MIRQAFIFFSVLLSFSAVANAQALVRSGEHEEFSRLVVYVPTDRPWNLEKTESGYRLVLEEWSQGFDISSIYDRMPRTRISSVSAEDSELEIRMNCNCPARGEIVEGIGLIVDVLDAVSESRDNEVSDDLNVSKEVKLNLPVIENTPNLQLTEVPLSDTKNPELDAFRRSLFEGLGRSASLSLVDLEESRSGDSDVTSGAGANSELAQAVEDGRVRVTTAVEEALNTRSEIISPVTIHECPALGAYEIHQWGGEADFSTQVAEARSKLVSEFDTPNPTDVRMLARLYLYFGLGAEARSVLAKYTLPQEEAQIIEGIAEILEPSSTPQANILEAVVDCEGGVVPWAILAREANGGVSEPEAKSAVAQFLKWPRHLQRYMGARLMGALTQSNRQESVEILEKVLERQGDSLPAEVKIGVAERRTKPEESLDDLLEIVRTGDDGAADALAVYLRIALEEDVPIDEPLIELASAFSKELKDSEVGHTLTNLSIEALVAFGSTSEALATLRREEALGLEPNANLGDRISRKLIERGSISDVVKFTLFLLEGSSQLSISSQSAIELSRRLLEGGFPEVAKSLSKFRDSSGASKRLEADIAMAIGDNTTANELLQSLLDNESVQRQVDLLVRRGLAADAWSQFNSTLPEEELSRLAWFAKQWQEVKPTTTEGTIASLLSRSLSNSLDVSPIAAARETSRNSEETRAAIQELLQ